MCWEMINPPQRPLLRSGGTSSMLFGSHKQLLLHTQPPPCSFQADVLKHNFLLLLPRRPVPTAASLTHSLQLSGSPTLHYACFTAVSCPSTSSKCYSSKQEQTTHAGGGGWEPSLRTAALYPVFQPGLFQFPALSYLELSQSSHIYLLCACLSFLICETDLMRHKRNTSRTITGWRDRNSVVKGLPVSIQLGSLFSSLACISLCTSQRVSDNHPHTIMLHGVHGNVKE